MGSERKGEVDERREEGSEMKTEAEIRERLARLERAVEKLIWVNSIPEEYDTAQIEALKWVLGE